jgi:Phage portal protein, lambda family
MRDLGVYVDNEIQASAIASCFTAFIKSDSPVGSLLSPTGEDSVDVNGNTLEYLEPGIVARLKPNESIDFANPGRPNSASEPWISLMLRGISAGTGTSYEAISKDFSKTSYSSSRTSKLEDRPRIKRWQNYMIWHLCQPVWDEFCNAAAVAGLNGFPTSAELLEDRRRYSSVEWQRPELEWVDVSAEQSSAESSLKTFTDTYQNVLGARGLSYRAVFYQRAKEDGLRKKLGLLTSEEQTAQMMAKQTEANTPAEAAEGESVTRNVAAEALNGAQITSLVDVITQVGTGAIPNDAAKAILSASFPTISPDIINSIIDPIKAGTISADGVPASIMPVDETATQTATAEMLGVNRRDWKNSRKATKDILDEMIAGTISEQRARLELDSLNIPPQKIDAYIADAKDGTIDTVEADLEVTVG